MANTEKIELARQLQILSKKQLIHCIMIMLDVLPQGILEMALEKVNAKYQTPAG